MGQTIKALQTKSEVKTSFPIMKQLRTHLDEDTFLSLVQEAQERDQYHLFALYQEEVMVALVGFKPMITLYYGRFVWVSDLVTTTDQRSNGYGAKLLHYVEEWAKKHNYPSIALSSGLQRTEAHRFYEENMDFDRVSYVFRKLV
ncbi:GNAT superfamily N-acetyltransferase [Natronobacillus azotifigens]